MEPKFLQAALSFLLLAGILPSLSTADGVDERLLSKILGYVNEREDACDDYFKYACGKWGNRHRSDHYSEVTGLIDYNINQKFVTLMRELAESHGDAKANGHSIETKILRYYQTCRRELSANRRLKHYLELVPPGEQVPWPQMARNSKTWPRSKFNWLETLGRLQRYGLGNVLVRLTVMPEYADSGKYIIDLDIPLFVEKRDRLKGVLSTKVLLRQLGVAQGSTLRLARSIRQLESDVRNLTESVEGEEELEEADLMIHLNVRQLERQVAAPWRKYLEILLGYQVAGNYQLQIRNIKYFVSLVRLLNESEPEVLASYIMARFVLYLQDESMNSDESIHCIQDVRRNMDLATNLLYEERYYGPKLQQYNAEVLELFELLRAQFLAKIETNSLHLKPAARDLIVNKVRSMGINIGNMPKRLDHRRFVSDFYANLSLGQSDYMDNHLKVLEFRTFRVLEQLQKPPRHGDNFVVLNTDSDSAMSSTPFYMLRQNIIVVPYGILQEPLFHADAHDIFKVSLFGFLLAHEITHGFDSMGLLYDAAGNANEIGIEIVDNPFYQDALGCMNRNETESLDERVADISGVRLAYDVYFSAGSKYSQAQPSFTNMPLKKLFFLNFAQFFCGDLNVRFSDHDSDDVRLKQTLLNFEPFAETYGCRKDRDAMHPAQKCRLWR